MTATKRKLRVLHILNSKIYSGAENVVITIIRNLGNSIEFAYESPDGSIREVLKKNSIKFFPVKATTPSEVRRVMDIFHPDIIHAHDFTAGIAAALTCTKIPIINHLHNNAPWISGYNIKSISYAIASQRITKILTVSEAIMNEYVFGRRLKTRTFVIGNPIDLNRIRKMAGITDVNQIYDLYDYKVHDIIFIGRETEAKDLPRFLKLIFQLKKKKSNLKVLMVGNGELHEQISGQIIKLKLSDCIEQIGFQSNPYIYLKNARVMMMTSKWEGFGLTAVEALSLGVPVVATPVGGLVDIVNDECGKLCRNDEEFIDEVEKLLNDESYYKEKSNAAVNRSMDFDNIDEYMKNIRKIYRTVINNSSERSK